MGHDPMCVYVTRGEGRGKSENRKTVPRMYMCMHVCVRRNTSGLCVVSLTFCFLFCFLRPEIPRDHSISTSLAL